MSQIWEDRAEQVSYCALGIVFVFMTSAVNMAQNGSANILKLGVCGILSVALGKRKLEGRKQIQSLVHGVGSISKPCTGFFGNRRDILCPKMRSGLGAGSRKSPKWEAVSVTRTIGSSVSDSVLLL